MADSLDQMLYQAFDVLDYALVSAPGAPSVKKALIEAGIGEDVYGSYGCRNLTACIFDRSQKCHM